MNTKILHLVIRFSDNLFGVGDVVAKHNEIVSKNGFVWFGKLGTTLSASRVEMLNAQVGKGILTYIYLVKGNRKQSIPYRASLLSIAKELPNSELNKFPSYYLEKDLVKYMRAWVKIGEIIPIEMSGMNHLRALNSVFPIQETLVRSSSGYFLVHEAKDIF